MATECCEQCGKWHDIVKEQCVMPRGKPKNTNHKPTGTQALYRPKNKLATSVALTPDTTDKLAKAQIRTGLSRSDVLCLLIDMHADRLTIVDVRVKEAWNRGV